MGTQIEGFFKLQLWGHGNGSVLVLWDLVAFGVMSCAAGQVSVPAPRLWSLLSARWAFPTAGRRSQVLDSHADTHRLPERGMQCRVTPPAVPWHSLEVKPVLAISPNKNPDPFPPISSLLMPLPVFPSSYLHGKKKIIPTSACCQRAPGRIYPFQPIEVPQPWSQVPPNVPVPPDLQSLAHNRGDKSLLSVPPPHAKPQHVPRAVASRAALLCQGAGFILRLI